MTEKKIILFNGAPLEEMNREQLIEIISDLAQSLDRAMEQARVMRDTSIFKNREWYTGFVQRR